MTAVSETEVTPTNRPPGRLAPSPSSLPSTVSILTFATLSLLVGVTSEGFLEADGCTHYLYARFALQEPHFLVNVWGRPLYTALYAIPSAYGGLLGAHLLSLILAIACGLVAQRIARAQGYRWPALALISTLAQPLVFLHSFSELTELPFALLLGLAFLAYQRRRWFVMALLVSLGPLSRPEGFGFLVLAAVALVAHRRWWWALVLPVPLIIWNHGGWLISGATGPWWRWLPDNWPYAADSLYPRGNALHFVALLPAVVSPLIFPATCVGLWRSLVARLPATHATRCQRLVAIIPLLILVVHSLLYATGKMASSGEIRYMLVVAPFWGLLSAKGWEWVFTRLSWRRPLAWAGAAAMAPVIANAIYPVLPLQPRPDEDFAEAKRFVDWYRAGDLASRYPRVCTAQMFIYYFLDVSPTDPTRALEYRRDRISPPPRGTILVWDPVYSLFNSDQRRSIPVEDLRKAGWVEIHVNQARIGDGWRVLLSEPAIESAATTTSPSSPDPVAPRPPPK